MQDIRIGDGSFRTYGRLMDGGYYGGYDGGYYDGDRYNGGYYPDNRGYRGRGSYGRVGGDTCPYYNDDRDRYRGKREAEVKDILTRKG